MIDSQSGLRVYGAPWCPHCKRVKRFLAAHRVAYENVDVDERPEAIGTLKELQDGGQIIPTVIYADGSHEVNPSDEALARRHGVELLSAVSVTSVTPDGDDLVTRLATGQELTSHAVIVATGSTYRRLDVPGEEDLIGAGVHFCATCDGPFYKGADELV